MLIDVDRMLGEQKQQCEEAAGEEVLTPKQAGAGPHRLVRHAGSYSSCMPACACCAG
jgi:hypothetical protein